MATEITQLLQRWADGEAAALDQLWPLVYDELRHQARRQLWRQNGQPTLQPTVLVHEAWLRLFRQPSADWQGRAQFYAFAARVMRSVLVDYVRQRQAEKRGGDLEQVSLSAADPSNGVQPIELLALDEALHRLLALHPQQSQIVELQFFGGLTIEETAHTLGVSHATVERGWQTARAWLYSELSK